MLAAAAASDPGPLLFAAQVLLTETTGAPDASGGRPSARELNVSTES
jgi:hypothetical protein